MSELNAALDQLRRAIRDEGPRPDVHREALHNLGRDWPTLYDAVIAVLKADDQRPAR